MTLDTDAQSLHLIAQPLPHFDVRLAPPVIDDWIPGNTGIAGITTFESGLPGPHVALMALTHGNEFAGAIVLDRMLRAGLRPVRGRLSFAFANIAAFKRFDPRRPVASRFVDEDLNRVWEAAVLDGPRCSVELDRAREMRPWVDTVDVLLDLHSMLWPSEPLILSGLPEKGRRLARAIGIPGLIVADAGHANGRRLIDYPRFSEPDTPYVGELIEAGQHWAPETVITADASAAAVLRHFGIVAPDALPPPPDDVGSRLAVVTEAVTAMSSTFAFVRAFRGGEVIPQRNTLIAMDGETEIRTPYDDCLLVMPSLRPSKGHTAVRLGRFVEMGGAVVPEGQSLTGR
ncbi:MAG: succinylglutamate desuccinylase/aspartoacylase family protein [Acetobacteraceae bacterium]